MSAQTAHRTNKIVVVDDDARIRDLLRRYLSQEGFEVTVAEDGRALNRLLLRDSVDLIVLDLMMPGEDGLSICRRLRAAADRTPIIMLTAKSEDVDRIVGLEVGADDYLGKPFNPRELLARIHAVLRRRPPPEVPGAPSLDQQLVKFGPFEFDLGQRTLRYETYVMPAPLEQHAAVYEMALRHNERLVGAHFAIGVEDALFLRGELPLAALNEGELDRVIGSLYAYVESTFPALIRLGYASHVAGLDDDTV